MSVTEDGVRFEAGALRYNKAYLHGFSALLQFMTDHVADRPMEERIGFVFDEQDEFRGRALQMFEALNGMLGFTRRDRLGRIAFEDSERHTPLQASDALT